MSDINVEELEQQSKDSWENVKKKEKAITDYLANNSLSTLPDGFDFDIHVDESYSYEKNKKFKLKINVKDANRKDGESYPKYFWSGNEGGIEFNFSEQDDVKYHASFGSGGYNGNEYNNKDYPEIDEIKIHELTLYIRSSCLTLMKDVKQDSTQLVAHCDEYIKAKQSHYKLREVINSEEKRIKDLQKENDVSKIQGKLQTATPERVTELFDELSKESDYVQQQSILKSTVHMDDIFFEVVNVECNRGAKVTYKTEYPSRDINKSIKKADVPELLSTAIVVDGKVLTSISDLLQVLETDKIDEIYESQNYRQKDKGIKIPIDTLVRAVSSKADISKFLSSKPKEEQKVKNTGSTLKR